MTAPLSSRPPAPSRLQRQPGRARGLSALLGALAASCCLSLACPSQAMPGFYVGKDSQDRSAGSTHVVLLRGAGRTAVTVMPDYDGPLTELAIVLPVPADVTPERVVTVKTGVVTALDRMTAPRFHEFWEMDPCEPGEAEQIWERDLKVKGAGFLGGGEAPDPEQATGVKSAKELSVDTELQTRPDTEYTFRVEEPGQVLAWLKKEGWVPPNGAEAALEPYVGAGMKFLIATVDTKKVELLGSGRAQLSAIRYWTEKEVNSVPARLGLLSAGKLQELFVYVLDKEKRFEVKNYETLVPPTNLEVTKDAAECPGACVQEKLADFYARYHDALRAKKPNAVLAEYAWSSDGCGEPCPPSGMPEPLRLADLLTLGGDVLDAQLPEAEREPEPPEMEEADKKAYDKAPKEQQELIDTSRKKVARVKALQERHQYVVSRLHHRYEAAGLPKDLELAPAGNLRGGVQIPKGEQGELPHDAQPADNNKLQTRFVALHPWIAETKCESPLRYRWGKPPRTHRGRKTIFVAQDMAYANPKKLELDKVLKSAVPLLGIEGQKLASLDAPPEPPAAEEKSCGCRLPGGAGDSRGAFVGVGLTLGLIAARRRRGSRSGL